MDSSLHGKTLSFYYRVVLSRLNECLTKVANCSSLIQIATVFKLKKNSLTCICRCIGDDHILYALCCCGRVRTEKSTNLDFNVQKAFKASAVGSIQSSFYTSVDSHEWPRDFRMVFDESSLDISCTQNDLFLFAVC